MRSEYLRSLPRPKLEIDVTRASRSTILLHITDSSASRWVELSLDDVEDLAKKLQAALLGAVGFSSRKR